MTETAPAKTSLDASACWRIGWTIATFLLVEIVICGVCALPLFALWFCLIMAAGTSRTMQIVLFASAIVPSYMVFAILLMIVSPLLIRLMGWRTPRDAEMRIAHMGWPLLNWVRYVASNHLVRVLAGTVFRGSPLWSAHLRLAGAKIGKRVYVNSLALNDYNLLEFGEGVIIGGGVHLSGHTAEGGIIKTATVRLGSNTTVGLGSIIDIGVETGHDCEIGALTFVPKGMKLDSEALYAGIPAK